MAAHTVPAIETTVQKTHTWLEELAQNGGFTDQSQAYSALRAVLHAIRDHLTVAEATDLAAQLPMLVRGFYYEGWNPAKAPNRARNAQDFLDNVRQSLPRNDTIDPQAACKAVFDLLHARVTAGEMKHVEGMFPRNVLDQLGVKAA